MKKNRTIFAFSSMMTSISSLFIVVVVLCFINLSAYANKVNEGINIARITSSLPQPNDTTPLTLSLVPYTYSNGYNISCFGFTDGSINLTVTGGTPPYKYKWSTGDSTEDVADLGSGFKDVTVTDKNGRRTTGKIDLTEPPQLNGIKADGQVFKYANGYNVSCISCFNGSIDVSVSGGSGSYLYEWRDGPTTQDRANLGKGDYTVFVKDASVCSKGENVRLAFELNEPPVDNWKMTGNVGTDPQTQFIGTIDNNAFTFRTNNAERLRISGNGNIGIGTNNPTEKLHIVGNGKVTGGFNISGNVGIGTLTPTEKLSVTGNAKISDNLFVDKKLRVQGSLRIDSLGGTGFKLDSMSNKSFKLLIVDEQGNVVANSPEHDQSGEEDDPLALCENSFIPWFTNGNKIYGNERFNFGTCTNRPINFITNSQQRMTLSNYGNLGINTENPKQKLHVNGNLLISGVNSSLFFGEETVPAGFGSYNGQWGIEYEDAAGGLNFWKPSGSNHFGNFFLFIKDDGNVGIGTNLATNPNNYKLAVNGIIGAREVMVEVDKPVESWPDYVFKKNYKLTSLKDLENYISQYNHLPDVPSSNDISENGLKLGEMNALLLKKVEELTLYIIEMNKQMELFKKQNEELQNKVNSIKN